MIVGGALFYFIYPFFNTVEVDDALPVAAEDERTRVVIQDSDVREEESESVDSDSTPDTTPPNDDNEEEAVVLASRNTTHAIVDTPTHPASGQVRVIEGSGGTIVRYEDFETINGPQLHLYLAKDLEANEFVDLGPIRGTKGNINYEIDSDIDISEYQYVMYWCKPFSVLFNYADISA